MGWRHKPGGRIGGRTGGRFRSCRREREPGSAGTGMLPVTAGSCDRISLGTTSRTGGMFGPLEPA
ncbi:hypothetical protein [Methylobacterium sp. J-070]|uniref:hypothetical protein n=1 Tax=Methylobacterium sp. J-070 TaxID=2836650 RepID=UPI001FBB8D96|nr:hypothetical protein [Methylobacterium sp. J-070]MCJ2050309.1 hypothetical protein [Methylobacterium sp. J-070]